MSEHWTCDDSVLLVVEGRAAVPEWLPHLGPPPPLGFSALEQEEWEPVSAFLNRLERTLARSVLDDVHAETIVVVLADDADDATLAARRLSLLSVMTHFAARGSGTVLLTHGVRHGEELHEELLDTARELAAEWEDAGVAVHARIEGHARVPELRKASEAPRPFSDAAARLAAP